MRDKRANTGLTLGHATPAVLAVTTILHGSLHGQAGIPALASPLLALGEPHALWRETRGKSLVYGGWKGKRVNTFPSFRFPLHNSLTKQWNATP